MNKNGFTLVELMVVILIIGILAGTTVPSHLHKINRARIEASEPYALVAKEAVEAYYKKSGKFPKDNREVSIPAKEKFIGTYITAVEVVDGAIHVTFGNEIAEKYKGAVLSIRPAHVKGEKRIPISWMYGFAKAPEGLTVAGENKTTFPPEAMPFEYR